MIALIDYGAGNVESVAKALRHLGKPVELTSDADFIRKADAVVLPGVGAFGDAVSQLRLRGLEEVVKESALDNQRPFLGICVGLQMLFDSSEESPEAEGLKLLGGRVLRLPSEGGLKVPHIGWNSIEYNRECPLFAGLPEQPYVYFVHSYYVPCSEWTIATSTFIHPYSAALHKDNFYTTQFHPEKSGKVGERILDNFLRIAQTANKTTL